MPLKTKYIRDGNQKIVGSVVSGFHDESSLVRDEHDHVLGRVSDKFHTTRDVNGKIISLNSADPGLLINKKK